MTSSTASDYYARVYGDAAPGDWRRWFESGRWPGAQLENTALKDFSEEDGRGIVYRMLAPHAPFRRVLDIGCSAGDFLVPLRKVAQEAHGVDIAGFPEAWGLLREKYGIQCRQHDLDKADLPFAGGYFDAVTMIMVLEHVFDVQHALHELARVLSPDGRAIVQVPNLAYLKHRLALFSGRLPLTADANDPGFDQSWDGQHLHNFNLAALGGALKRHGLRIVRSGCFGRFAKLRSRWPSLLGADLTLLVIKA